jgi:hypothetical protein
MYKVDGSCMWSMCTIFSKCQIIVLLVCAVANKTRVFGMAAVPAVSGLGVADCIGIAVGFRGNESQESVTVIIPHSGLTKPFVGVLSLAEAYCTRFSCRCCSAP